ncbi:MAG: 50S ribosomal protein L3 [gamma proteobacterium symbiont of Bathyaustriella thionipta]|nr:50S ribosomal protein L3 [gamma proteobacterium symbiont of Bathyaustriella thionipta]
MTIGIVGKKIGMTRIFTESGESLPVSVIQAEPNRVTQLKTVEADGYAAVQVTVGSRKASRVNKASAGHYAKAGVEAGTGLWEFRLPAGEGDNLELGSAITIEQFEAGQKVDVQGRTKGKGFAGGVKRHNFAMQDATHGNSISHRAPGSIGQCQTPGRVFKGKKMAGHMGDVNQTTQNLEIVRVDNERNLLLIKGAVPGSRNSNVIVKTAVKGV